MRIASAVCLVRVVDRAAACYGGNADQQGPSIIPASRNVQPLRIAAVATIPEKDIMDTCPDQRCKIPQRNPVQAPGILGKAQPAGRPCHKILFIRGQLLRQAAYRFEMVKSFFFHGAILCPFFAVSASAKGPTEL